jgi:hypothetical protein
MELELPCPVCGKSFTGSLIERHINECLDGGAKAAYEFAAVIARWFISVVFLHARRRRMRHGRWSRRCYSLFWFSAVSALLPGSCTASDPVTMRVRYQRAARCWNRRQPAAVSIAVSGGGGNLGGGIVF